MTNNKTPEEIEIEVENIVKQLKYEGYLQSKKWRDLRHRKLVYENFTCKHCGYSPLINAVEIPLDVHHLTYERFENEDWDDLIVLCRECHKKFHEKEGTK